jgi:hypothetical protein
MSAKARSWVSGLALIIAGLVLARVISPGYSGQTYVQFGVYIGGVTLALAGLGVILMGIRKK